jgi:hypothetical protein
VRRVLLEVSHELITCHPAAKIARNPVTRKVGQPADGVQVETVVAGPPWLADTLAPLRIVASIPRARSVAAAASPAGPAPTMTTSSTCSGYG